MARNTSKIEIRKMTAGDIPLGMRLKSMANWNQLESDWELLLREGNEGNLVAVYNGEDCGTTTTISYEQKFCWIGMVLVDPAYRGLGIGSALLKEANKLAKNNDTIRLDATPTGSGLYEHLGFINECTLERMVWDRNFPFQEPTHEVFPVDEEMLQEIIVKDSLVFGANRESVIKHFFNNAPEYALYIGKNDYLKGYCFGRHGYYYEQIGPIIAEDLETAYDLLLNAMKNGGGKPVALDTFIFNNQWLATLNKLGFQRQRPLYRMYRGHLTTPGIKEKQFAIAGPELG